VEPDLSDMQPLSSFGPGIHCEFGEPDIVSSRPLVAVRIAECIAEWTEIETLLGLLLALLLDANAKAAMAMYGATENRATQIKMLTAAAEHKMPEDEQDVLEAVLSAYVRPASKYRDKLAHWCWGRSPKFPEALLLTPPTTKIPLHHYALDAPSKPKIDPKTVFVIKEGDLERATKHLRKVQSYLNDIISMVREADQQKRALALHRLSNEPPIPEALTRIRAGRQNNQATQPPPPQSVTNGTP
jgi:hypothetical protein